MLPDLAKMIEATTPFIELELTLSSLNSACSTRMSYSPWIFFPRKYFDQSEKKHKNLYRFYFGILQNDVVVLLNWNWSPEATKPCGYQNRILLWTPLKQINTIAWSTIAGILKLSPNKMPPFTEYSILILIQLWLPILY